MSDSPEKPALTKLDLEETWKSFVDATGNFTTAIQTLENEVVVREALQQQVTELQNSNAELVAKCGRDETSLKQLSADIAAAEESKKTSDVKVQSLLSEVAKLKQVQEFTLNLMEEEKSLREQVASLQQSNERLTATNATQKEELDKARHDAQQALDAQKAKMDSLSTENDSMKAELDKARRDAQQALGAQKAEMDSLAAGNESMKEALERAFSTAQAAYLASSEAEKQVYTMQSAIKNSKTLAEKTVTAALLAKSEAENEVESLQAELQKLRSTFEHQKSQDTTKPTRPQEEGEAALVAKSDTDKRVEHLEAEVQQARNAEKLALAAKSDADKRVEHLGAEVQRAQNAEKLALEAKSDADKRVEHLGAEVQRAKNSEKLALEAKSDADKRVEHLEAEMQRAKNSEKLALEAKSDADKRVEHLEAEMQTVQLANAEPNMQQEDIDCSKIAEFNDIDEIEDSQDSKSDPLEIDSTTVLKEVKENTETLNLFKTVKEFVEKNLSDSSSRQMFVLSCKQIQDMYERANLRCEEMAAKINWLESQVLLKMPASVLCANSKRRRLNGAGHK